MRICAFYSAARLESFRVNSLLVFVIKSSKTVGSDAELSPDLVNICPLLRGSGVWLPVGPG